MKINNPYTQEVITEVTVDSKETIDYTREGDKRAPRI